MFFCRCKVNDAPFVLFLHVWECRLHVVQGADYTALPCFEHAIVGGIFYRCGWNNGLTVVDNDVNGAKSIHGFLHNGSYTSRIAGVTGKRQAVAPQFLDGLLNWF